MSIYRSLLAFLFIFKRYFSHIISEILICPSIKKLSVQVLSLQNIIKVGYQIFKS